MTKFGKVLVLLNVVFSFSGMAWALSLYANRIDWSDQPSGELAMRQPRIDKLWAAVRPAEAAWREPRGAILAVEQQRPDQRAWYAAELEQVRTGADNKPARKVVFERGVPDIDPAGNNRPKMEPATDRKGQPLRSLVFYEKELNTERENLVAELKKHTGLVDEDTRLTILLVGKQDPVTKGLRQRIVDERGKYQDLEREQELAKPMLINAYVESQLIRNRAETLKARIEQLERLNAGGVAVDK